MNICKSEIYFVILLIIIFYLNYSNKNKEGFQSSSTTTGYQADIEAIRNLSSIATTLMAGGITVPGNLNVTGNINTTGNINLLPSGMIIAYTGTNEPTGYLLCNGQTLNADTNSNYKNLFNVIGNQFGGTNSTNFKVPDYRGMFLRGTGISGVSGYTNYRGQALNTPTTHATQTHTHNITDSGHTHGLSKLYNFLRWVAPNGDRSAGYGNQFHGEDQSTDTAYANITINDSSSTGNRYTDPNETRPVNYSVNYLIKI
jgi:microcystin-dependent protein